MCKGGNFADYILIQETGISRASYIILVDICYCNFTEAKIG